MTEPHRVALLNPNSNPATTAAMLGLARAAAPAGLEIVGFTADRTPPMLTRPSDLAAAADWVGAMLPDLAAAGFSAALVAAFGDPGVERFRPSSPLPLVGIAEAGMTLAARGGRRFAVVTTTPELEAPIATRAVALGFADRLAAVRITEGDPLALMDDEDRLIRALAEIATAAVTCDGAEAVLIGGGPLGPFAAAVARRVAVPVIEPVAAGITLIAERLAIISAPAGPAADDGGADRIAGDVGFGALRPVDGASR
jgi:Asp/Glu/hydantoin racemase